MSMPNHLILVRHGESEGNFVRSAYKKGDESYLTPAYRQRPGHEWRITAKGVEQARAAGQWIQRHIIEEYELEGFDRYLHSPHRRTRETAAYLELPEAKWRLNRLLREREWGELTGLVEREHKQLYPRNYAWMKADPIHWAPPGGDSISQVADNRVRELFDSLHRDHEEKGVEAVVAVTHGEWMWATRLALNYMSNEDYVAAEHNKDQKIHNCQVVHYTRINPKDGTVAPFLRWHRSVCPWRDPDAHGEWSQSRRTELSNEELLEQVEAIPRLFEE